MILLGEVRLEGPLAPPGRDPHPYVWMSRARAGSKFREGVSGVE